MHVAMVVASTHCFPQEHLQRRNVKIRMGQREAQIHQKNLLTCENKDAQVAETVHFL